jgi:transcriptional regulator with XRE-family HTH domain
MLGNILEKIRINKNISKNNLAKVARINVGHLTHIEKEQRNPSGKTLKLLCQGLGVPMEPLLHFMDKDLTQEQKDYNAIDHLKYDSVPIVSGITGFGTCPNEAINTSFIMKCNDDSMEPKISVSDFMYVELYVPLSNKDIGLFSYNNKIIVRKFIIRKNDIVLRAENPGTDDIIVNKDSDFYILGKIIGKNNDKMNKYVAFF